ncbi:Phosphatidylinositol 3,4,5-trisphosphate 3-phosphatase TPTE2 [Halotydeus destructor]|nr:Phosphatidylinositol 3,4,5-trisphosphate 3-phosphatase TPTE2 [Halotydeus destructor]
MNYEPMEHGVDITDVAPTRSRSPKSNPANRESQFSTIDLELNEGQSNGSKGPVADAEGQPAASSGRKGKVLYDSFPSYADSPDDLTTREKLRYFLEHIFFRLFSLFMILADCTVLVIDVTLPKDHDDEQKVYDNVAMLFVTYFVIELALRMYSQRIEPFFNAWYNKVDFVVIVMSFVVTAIYHLLDGVTGVAKLVALGRFVRVFVLIRLIRVIYTEPRNVQRGIRHVVSENKRRLREGQFDLDMTYITKNVIGMSFPSSGRMALYRNNIKDVAKYLDTVHGPGHYKVYNLCAEKSYESSFFHDSVARYSIDDHNVPSLEQMVEFVNDVKAFLGQDDSNVIAVHCKGGKGRTGTMICAWLIFDGQFDNSKNVLDYFGEQRTDKTIGSKYQGVETPSQARYIDYFTQVHNQYGGKIPNKVPLVLKNLKITSLIGVGAGNGSDLTCTIGIDRESTFAMGFGSRTNCEIDYNAVQDVLEVTPRNCPPLIGNVRLKFNCSSKTVPRAYEDCAFYFWFNTAFVDQEAMTLTIKREDLDNPHKEKTWKLYREKFSVRLEFAQE